MNYVLTMKDSSVGMVIPASKFHAFIEGRRETVSPNFRERLSQLNEFLAHNRLPTAIDWEMIEE